MLKAKLRKLEEKISRIAPDPPRPEDLRLMPFGLLGCKYPGPVVLEVNPRKYGKEIPVPFFWCKTQEGSDRRCEECEYNGYEEACRLIREGRAEELKEDRPLVMQVEELSPTRWRITVALEG